MRRLQIRDRQFGHGQRLLHQENELENVPMIPVPVEYDDIDKAMFVFVDNEIELSDENGDKVPTFKLLGNQRFGEYSQTWEHTDANGNLLMNFKTVSRDINQNWGSIHGGMSNIPGENRFTLHIREVVDDTGVEYYEVTSMSQPLAVDFIYDMTFITSKLENINRFNVTVMQLFQSKQCYLYPNGHAMPMSIENVSDESNYEIDGRKFFKQTISVKVFGYVIPENDIKVDMKPKRRPVNDIDSNFKRTYVDMEYNKDGSFNLNVRFAGNVSKVEFVVDEPMKVRISEKTNANGIHVKVENEDIDSSGDMIFNEGEKIIIRIKKPSPSKMSMVVLSGVLVGCHTSV